MPKVTFGAGFPIKGVSTPPVEPATQPSSTRENLLQQLVRQCISDSAKYFPDYDSAAGSPTGRLQHHVLALCGESGELANLVKKIDRGSLDYDHEGVRLALADEATDVLIYLLNIFGELGVDPLREFLKKRDFNDKRFIQKQQGGARG
jgi:NTP pyrophosphatase (non-canonical NTP hydrolase)